VNSDSSAAPNPRTRKEVLRISIREYLTQKARGITKGALSDYRLPAAFQGLLPERRRQDREMLSFDNCPLAKLAGEDFEGTEMRRHGISRVWTHGERMGDRWLIQLLVLFAVVMTHIDLGRAVSEPVWQIGKFNASSSEFNSGSDPITGLPTIDYRDPSQDPVYVVGASTPSKNWFASQPGSADADSGFRPHPFTILFDLPGPPTGRYTLKVGTLIDNPRVSILQVDINGRRGWFYQRAKLIYTGEPIVLFDRQKKIEFINQVRKEKVFAKEKVYFAFPLALNQPQFAYEIQAGFVDPVKDLLPGAGREWFSVQHWVAVHQPDLAAAIVPVDAPLITLGDVVRGAWPTEFGLRKATVFSYIMNNYWDTNYVAGQGGDFTFRYVFTSGREFQPGSLSRLGWEEMAPLEADLVTYLDKAVDAPRPLNGAEASFLQVDSPHVVLVTWKRAEDEHGTILRLVEVAGQTGTVKITAPLLPVKLAWLCNALEENQQPLAVSGHTVSFPVHPFQIVTVRVEGEKGVKQP
jgi:hypothetical protein